MASQKLEKASLEANLLDKNSNFFLLEENDFILSISLFVKIRSKKLLPNLLYIASIREIFTMSKPRPKIIMINLL